jgi:hypothetical protein
MGKSAPAATAPVSLPKKTHRVRNILAGVAALFVGLMILGAIVGDSNKSPSGGSSVNTPAPMASPDLTVDARQLFADYEANEVAADEKYKGKIVDVSGTVNSIGKDLTDTIYVTLSTGEEIEVFNVQLFFSNDYEAQTAKLQKQDFLQARCHCDGKFGNVMLKDCVIEVAPEHASQ